MRVKEQGGCNAKSWQRRLLLVGVATAVGGSVKERQIASRRVCNMADRPEDGSTGSACSLRYARARLFCTRANQGEHHRRCASQKMARFNCQAVLTARFCTYP